MNNLQILAQFNFDSSIDIERIKYNDIVYNTEYRMFSQWQENGLEHFITISEQQNKMFELTYNRYFTWKVIREEKLI